MCSRSQRTPHCGFGSHLTTALVGVLWVLFAAGCSTADSSGFAIGATEKSVVRIGYQKSSGLLNLLRRQRTLEDKLGPAVEVTWQEFAAGPQMLEALNVGSVDFGTSGEAPPVFAQAAGASMVYLAVERVGPQGEGILVRPDSKYHTLAELKGKRIALNKASNVHYFLVRALESVGLRYTDIVPVFLTPADGRAAFESGRVDAWVIWDPFYTAAIEAGQARLLMDGQGLVENYQFYFSTRQFAERQPQTIDVLLSQLRIVNDWAESHRDEFADFIADILDLDRQVLRIAERRRQYGIGPMSDEIVAYQQSIADTFFQLGLLPHEVHIHNVIWNSSRR
jgi:sulfonate transport system substrate-binding protein